MNRRIRSLAAVAALAAPIALPLTVGGQSTGSAEPASWAAPRTADGHPDLQGHWTNDTYTPFERPVELGDKQSFTAEEAAAFFQVARRPSCMAQADDDIHYDDAIWQAENYAKVAQPADVADHRAAQRPTTGADARDGEARLPQQRATQRAVVGRQRREPLARRALHLVGQRRAADDAADVQRESADPTDRATWS